MDLNLLPLARRGEQELLDLPGLYLAAAPRRTARGRQSDRLFLYLAMEGNLPFSAGQQEQLLGRVAQAYYKTPGSVTAALRAAADTLNQVLLERNLSSASAGQQGIGVAILFTMRENRLTLAQCGPAHSYLVTPKEIQHFYDPQPTRRGLGLGKTTPIYFSQAVLNDNDLLLLAPQLPPAWNESLLNGIYGQSMDALRPRLLRQISGDLNALLIQVKTGPGKTFLMRPKPTAAMAVPPPTPVTGDAPHTDAVPLAAAAAVTAAAASEVQPLTSDLQVQQSTTQAPPPEPVAAAEQIEPTPPVLGAAPSVLGPAPSVLGPALEPMGTTPTPERVSPPPQPAAEAPPARRTRMKPTRRSVFATMAVAVRTTAGEFTQSMRTLFRRMLPGEGLATLPGPWMAFIAVAIPLVVVAIAMVVYFQRGRAGQYEAYLAQAQQAAAEAQALAQTDPTASLEKWESTLVYLDQADAYGSSPEADALRAQAYQAIDSTELIKRLDYKPALIGGLPDNAHIIDLVATTSDLYMLDASQGLVHRAFVTARGYELDTTFQCGPGFPTSQDIGPLVDIEGLPEGGGPALMGMDGRGTLLYCKPGEPPIFDVLAPPFTQFGQTTRFTIDSDNLYVLDPTKNAVWIYWNSDKAVPPDPFFTQDFPPMQDVIDLAVDGTDLFLLHADGHTTLCIYSDIGVAPTRCTDPLPYIDQRPGHEGQPITDYPTFIRITRTLPPDPSLYLLDPAAQSLYHFSERLAYQRQLLPAAPLSTNPDGSVDPATSFGFSPDNRIVFLSVGNQVYTAAKP